MGMMMMSRCEESVQLIDDGAYELLAGGSIDLFK
jgi:hypothetical protein